MRARKLFEARRAEVIAAEAAWAGDGSLELRGEEEGDPSVVARGRGGPQQFEPKVARGQMVGANVVVARIN